MSSFLPPQAMLLPEKWFIRNRMSMVFMICSLLSLYLNRRQHLFFSLIVTWVLILLGGIESIWGLRQIYDFAVSNHSLYVHTSWGSRLKEWGKKSLLIVHGIGNFAESYGEAHCKKWYNAKMLYNIGAYQSVKEEYEELYSGLNNRGIFLFEYGHCLHKLKEYDSSIKILKEAMRYSNDPMILNVIGKKYQAMGEYTKAEEWLIRSTHRLPGRIYPYYLLAKLYADSEYRKPDKLKNAIEVVLTKEPKIHSTAVKKMREEVKVLLKSMNP